MKYFIDTEFIEGFHKPLFGKKRHFIDLISIGIVCEDGRSYYAISNEFNSKDADLWVKENVISKLPIKIPNQHDSPRVREESYLYKSNKRIAEDIMLFCGREVIENKFGDGHYVYPKDIEFYAYYADYDWVLFCSLFGRMIDLPEDFPKYCKDLKQSYDEKIKEYAPHANFKNEEIHRVFKTLLDVQNQENEHNALDDAKWTFKLYNALTNFKSV